MTKHELNDLYVRVAKELSADPTDADSSAQKVGMLLHMAAAIHMATVNAAWSTEHREEMVRRTLAEWGTTA